MPQIHRMLNPLFIISPDDIAYKILGTILKKGGLPTEVVNQLDVARESGIPHSMQVLVRTLYTMAGMHEKDLEACRIDEALKMFMNMQMKGLEPDVASYTRLVTQEMQFTLHL
eukprot:Gb_05493 [translate_table: standard]